MCLLGTVLVNLGVSHSSEDKASVGDNQLKHMGTRGRGKQEKN